MSGLFRRMRTLGKIGVVFGLAIMLALGAGAFSLRGQEGKGLADLPALGVDIQGTSVSGISSGAYMAGQFQVAHSSIVKGAGIVAGGPYGCAESKFSRLWPIWTTAVPHNLNRALNACMSNRLRFMGVPDVDRLVRRTREMADDGSIDPVHGLEDDRIYLYWAMNDPTVAESVMVDAREYYRKIGVPDDQVVFIKGAKGGHAFITEDKGLACGLTGRPYLNDCDYDQAGAILRHIYGALKEESKTPQGEFMVFDQQIFYKGLGDHGLAREGVVYVPRACRGRSGCRVHIVFHGCEQSREFVGDKFVKGSGFAEWADNNRLVIVFPQVRKSTFNPKGCWDWWGYTGLDFRVKSSPQIQAVWRMLKRLEQRPSGE